MRRRAFRGAGLLRAPVLALVLGLGLGACASPGSIPLTATGNRVITVVAAENFWGSIVGQIGGSHVQVTSVITNPDTDPHSYEPTVADARALADARLVVDNGIGYDPWVDKLLSADGGDATVLDVGTLLGVRPGGNPHRWYNPADVQRVVHRLLADLQALDPADRQYFARQLVHFDSVSLRSYDAAVAAIRTCYGGTAVGASESIFAMVAPALGLRLVTPPRFLKAISEGTEVSPADVHTIDEQIERHEIAIYVYNSQNVTPDVQAQLALVKSAHIPYATITETLAPASSSYEAWQTRQLLGVEHALGDGGGTPMTGDAPALLRSGGGDAAVRFDAASVRRGGKVIWANVTLEVLPGEFVAVLGPNGVGKSTLVQAALGLLPLSAGTAAVLGRRPGAAGGDIGYLPQRRSFDGALRVRGVDVVRLGADGERWGVPFPGGTRFSSARRATRRRVDEVIELVGATAFAHRPIGEVSGGEQQRLLIAQALVRRPQLLLLDEPLDSLDLPNQAAVASLVSGICRHLGITVLLVADDVNPILPYLDRVIYMAQGGAVAGRPETVITSDTLSVLYDTPIEVLHASDGRLVVVGQPEAPAHHSDRHGAHPW